MPAKKTLSMGALLFEINHLNEVSTCGPEERRGWNRVMLTMLESTNNYFGFIYLPKNRVPAGHAPGINSEFPATSPEAFVGCDETRGWYMVGDDLQKDYNAARAAWQAQQPKVEKPMHCPQCSAEGRPAIPARKCEHMK